METRSYSQSRELAPTGEAKNHSKNVGNVALRAFEGVQKHLPGQKRRQLERTYGTESERLSAYRTLMDACDGQFTKNSPKVVQKIDEAGQQRERLIFQAEGQAGMQTWIVDCYKQSGATNILALYPKRDDDSRIGMSIGLRAGVSDLRYSQVTRFDDRLDELLAEDPGASLFRGCSSWDDGDAVPVLSADQALIMAGVLSSAEPVTPKDLNGANIPTLPTLEITR